MKATRTRHCRHRRRMGGVSAYRAPQSAREYGELRAPPAGSRRSPGWKWIWFIFSLTEEVSGSTVQYLIQINWDIIIELQ